MKKEKKILIISFISAIFILMIVCGVIMFMDKENKRDNEITNVNENKINNSQEASGDNMPNTPIVNNTLINGSGDKINISENINKEEIKVGELFLSDMSLKYKDGLTMFYATVFNNSSIDYPEGAELEISFFNESGNLITTLYVVTSTLNSNSSSTINARSTIDCSNASDVRIKVVNDVK